MPTLPLASPFRSPRFSPVPAALVALLLPALFALAACAKGDTTPDGGVRRDGMVDVDGGPRRDASGPAPRCGAVGGGCCTGRTCELGLTCGRGDQCCAIPGGARCSGPADCCTGFTCTGGECVAPAGAGCTAGDCARPLICETGRCVSPPVDPGTGMPMCGAAGMMCCAGFTCSSGSVCSTGMCRACGDTGQPCCDGATACSGSLFCMGGTCQMPMECGDSGQPCCAPGATCSGGLDCTGGMCGSMATAGGMGEPCRPRNICDDGFVCDAAMRMCVPVPSDCGTDGQMCCTTSASGGTCSGALNCESGACSSCRGPSISCLLGGLPGQECCNGAVCRPAPFIPRCCQGEGTACTNSLDCCGFMQCTDGMCAASMMGSFCTDSAECGEGLTCQSFTCQPGMTMCVDAGTACGPMGAASCCSGLSCREISRGSAPLCCSEKQGSCENSVDCCGKMLCTEGMCACQTEVQTCAQDGDCCDGLICVVGSCTTDDGCQREGTDCTTDGMCCGALVCGLQEDGNRNCCASDAQPCVSTDDCCGLMQCVMGECACRMSGDPCAADRDCCGASTCDKPPGSLTGMCS